MITINWIVLCDSAVFNPNGKLDLFGVYSGHLYEPSPLVITHLSVVFGVSIIDRTAVEWATLTVKYRNATIHKSAPVTLRDPAACGVVDAIDLVLQTPGEYDFQIRFDDVVVAVYTLYHHDPFAR